MLETKNPREPAESILSFLFSESSPRLAISTHPSLEQLARGVMLVDGEARVLFANWAVRTLFESGGGLALKAGYLRSANVSGVLEGLIASCAHKVNAPIDLGGNILIPRGLHRSPLRVTVTPLRSRGTVAELPWLGLEIPVAIVTVVGSDCESWMN
jgi:hypothetical protein